MTYHGGKVMPTANIQPIFWGTSWGSYAGDKITGIQSWYAGYSNSGYAQTSTEYSNGSPGTVFVGAQTTTGATVVDPTPASSGTNAVLAEVGRAITNPDTSGNGYYPVYTDLPRGSANYCAWHSSGTVNGVLVQFAFFWKLDGDPGCDPQSTLVGPGQSQGLAAIANVTGHELAEAMTDPASPGAWYDSAGSENGDKCAWTYGGLFVTFSNGTQWKIQGEWSNAAYQSPTLGYKNSAGQKGCLGGA